MSDQAILLPLDDESQSVSEKTGTVELSYVALHVDSRQEAVNLAIAQTPFVLATGHDRTSVKAKFSTDARGGRASVKVSYTLKELNNLEREQEVGPPPGVEELSVSFGVGGKSRMVTHSFNTRQMLSASDGEQAPDFMKAINVVDGTPQGVEINPSAIADSSFTVDVQIRTSLLTNQFVRNVDLITNRFNSVAYRGRQPGELLFSGMQGTYKLKEDYSDLSFEFFVTSNELNVSQGPFSGINRRGWDYFWIYSQKQENTQAKKIIQMPVACYVEEVLRSDSFSSLPIAG